jgi:hypothetical protein
LNAGFGIHEAVMYYQMVRELLSECYDLIAEDGGAKNKCDIDRLIILRDEWLKSPDSSGRMPADVIETERRRLNLLTTADECLIDDDCPLCVAMYEEFDTPMFTYYDGCNMDDRFEFSFYKTRQEWDEERRRYEEYSREYKEKRAKEQLDGELVEEDPF